MIDYFKSLIRNGTKDSAKAFVMVIGVLAIIGQMIITDVLIFLSINEKFNVNWVGVASVYTALAALAAALIWGKVKGEDAYYGSLPDGGEEKTNENTPLV